jgi:sec-independent protein translocase protein TatC
MLGLAAFAVALGAGGVSFGYWIVLPRAMHFLTNYDSTIFVHLIQARAYYSFVATVLIGIVIVFQLPLVVLGLVGLGVLSSRTLRKHRRVGYLVVSVIALALPGPDPMTTFLELLPMWALFEGSIWLAVLFERRQPLQQAALHSVTASSSGSDR